MPQSCSPTNGTLISVPPQIGLRPRRLVVKLSNIFGISRGISTDKLQKPTLVGDKLQGWSIGISRALFSESYRNTVLLVAPEYSFELILLKFSGKRG